MKKIECVYLEDSISDQSKFGSFLKTAWAQIAPRVAFELTTTDDPERALGDIRADRCGLFVADIFMGSISGNDASTEQRAKHGLHAIAQARQLRPDLPILALSFGGEELRQQSYDSGADAFIGKNLVHAQDPKLTQLASAIRQALEAHRVEPIASDDTKLRYDVGDFDLVSVIAEIGESTVTNLIHKLARKEQLEKIELKFVTAGLSGAHVLRVTTSFLDDETPDTLSFLAKVSRSESGLLAEITNKEKCRRFPTALFIECWGDKPVKSDGWFAIAIGFLEGATTLSNFVCDQTDQIAVQQCLDQLWLEKGLSEVRASPAPAPRRSIEGLADLLPVGRKARVNRALRELEPLLAAEFSRLGLSTAVITNFLESGQVGDVNAIQARGDMLLAWSHGDLHGRNILVDIHSRPHLIDPANVARMHWAADSARLFADLALAALAQGADSYSWHSLGTWVDQLIAIGTLTPVSGGRPALVTISSWLVRNLSLAHSACWSEDRSWEWQLAFAIELLRASYRITDLTAPKRGAALIAAAGILASTGNRLRA